MVKVDLKGIFKVTAKGRDYYYAWRGGPRLKGAPGTAEFHASYVEAHEQLRAPDPARFRSLVVAYRASADYAALADSTKRNWSRWLDRIEEYFGDLSLRQFDRSEKIRPIIIRWRNRWASTPRTADYAMQVLSRVLSFGVDPMAKIASNPCEGVKQLYKGASARAEIIWLDSDIEALKRTCSIQIAHAVDLAAHTGLRLGDLLRLSWSHIGDVEIVLPTGKSRGRRAARIPIYDGLRAVLDRIPKQATTVLASSLRRPWTADGFGSSFNKAKIDAGMADADLHFHDLRGTAATKFYLAQIETRVIAEIMAWSESEVDKIIRRYVGRDAATKALIAQLRTKKGT